MCGKCPSDYCRLFVLEAFREYCDDLRDHMGDNYQKRQKFEITSSVMRMRLSRPRA